MILEKVDPQIAKLITKEEQRQTTLLNMIPSENFTSRAVREALGSILGHKYSEGNIGQRYYEGVEEIDRIEQLAIDRAAQLFNIPKDWSVNVQALSGSYANLAALLAVLNPGDTIMSMYLPDGGHLSHGWSYNAGKKTTPAERIYLPGEKKVHVVAKLFNIVQYKVNAENHLIDYAELEKLVKEQQPKMLISGGTAYPRNIDHQRMAEIAHSVNALYLADIAHEAGLIATGTLPSPVGIADIVTMTTHKTLRAARGALILAHSDIISKVNKAVLPGIQGGPFNNNIAAIAVGLKEALAPEFRKYTDQVVSNAQALADSLQKEGLTLVSGGTDKHLVLIDLTDTGVFGKVAAKALARAGIVANMNTIPGDARPPADPSGLRLGTPMITTFGLKEKHMPQIAAWIKQVITDPSEATSGVVLQEVKQFVKENFVSLP